MDALEGLPLRTRPMFGCLAVYLDEKILLIFRHKETGDRDNGCWVATHPEHHRSLGDEFPSLRSIELFGPKESAWRNLPETAGDFESSALEICELIRRGDPRIGRIPKSRTKKKKAARKAKNKPGKKKKTAKKAKARKRASR